MDKEIIKQLINEVLAEKLEIKAEVIPSFKCTKAIGEVIKEKGLQVKETATSDVATEIDFNIKAVKAMGDNKRTRQAYRPTPEQLAMINKTAKEDQDEQSGYVFTFQATNLYNSPDRRMQFFSNEALSLMAHYAMSNVIPFLLSSEADCEDHAWKAINAKGYVFNAYTKDGGLFYDVYVPEDAGTKPVIDSMFNGRLNKLSVGFAVNPRDILCTSCKTKSIFDDACPHMPGQEDENGKMVYENISKVSDNYEISGVAVPCQAGAKITGKSLINSSDLREAMSLASPQELASIQIPGLDVSDFMDLLGAKPLEKSHIDKINNGKNTIEGNSPMVENLVQETVADQAPEVTPEVEMSVEAPIVETANEETKLCKIAENAKSAAVSEIKALLDEQTKAFLSELAEIKSEVAELKQAKKQLKKQLKKSMKKFQAELELQASVPGSQSLVDATRQAGANPLQASADVLLEQPKAESVQAIDPILAPFARQ